MFNKKIFISSTLPYLSGTDSLSSGAHLGHLFEFVLTDVLARFYRYTLGNENVFFNTGVDEHGQKIFNKAKEEGLSPQEFCDRKAALWIQFCKKFNISYDNFYRTTSTEHKKRAVDFFENSYDNIYLTKYSGIYCEGCESFKTPKELTNGSCEQHPTLELKEISEENFFFNLKKFAPTCVPDNILVNNTLRNELDNLIANAEDISVSRNKDNVSWAIPIPVTNQTIYLWYEALSNYVFAAGYIPNENPSLDFASWWVNSLIVCGKDNLRFQALILPAILAANNISSPKKVLVHGTILDDKGNKMSKTTGNVVDPIEQLEKFGLDSVRYYLVAGLNTFSNSKYSEKELILKFNNDIVKGYGNLVSRALHLIDIKNIELTDACEINKLMIDETAGVINECFQFGDLKNAYAKAYELVSWANKYITDTKPFSEECENRVQILSDVYYLLKTVSPFYQFVFPDKAEVIETALREKKKVILFQLI